MGLSFWHLLLVFLVVLLLFGPGRLPKLMGDIGKVVRSMREGLKSDEDRKE